MSYAHRFGRPGCGLSYRNLRESVGCLVVWLLDQSLKSPRRSLVRSYIEDIKIDTILYAIRPLPSNLDSFLRIAYSELNSPFRPAGQHLVVSELAVVGGVLGCWTFVQSLMSSHSSCARRSLVRTYIDDIKADTILYAIRPPRSNLHSHPLESIQ